MTPLPIRIRLKLNNTIKRFLLVLLHLTTGWLSEQFRNIQVNKKIVCHLIFWGKTVRTHWFSTPIEGLDPPVPGYSPANTSHTHLVGSPCIHCMICIMVSLFFCDLFILGSMCVNIAACFISPCSMYCWVVCDVMLYSSFCPPHSKAVQTHPPVW